MNRMIYLVVAMLVMGYIAVVSVKYIKSCREERALEIWKSYVIQARGAASVGSPIPQPPGNLPSGYYIQISGNSIELRNSSGVVASDWYR